MSLRCFLKEYQKSIRKVSLRDCAFSCNTSFLQNRNISARHIYIDREKVRFFQKTKPLLIIVATIALFFSFIVPTFAIAPPFPTTNWLHQETSAVIGNSWQMPGSDMDQVENQSTRNKVQNTTTEWQFRPGVGQNNNGGITNGYGWIFDSPLNGQYDAGTWTFYVRLHRTKATATGVVRAYVKRYDGASTYTDLFTATSASITPGTSAATYSFTASPGAVDMQGQYLYVHYTWQTSSGGGTGGNATYEYFDVEGTGLAAADKARIIPASSSISTLGYFLLSIAVAFFVWMMVKKRVLYIKRAVV